MLNFLIHNRIFSDSILGECFFFWGNKSIKEKKNMNEKMNELK